MISAHTEASVCCPPLAVDSPDRGIRQRLTHSGEAVHGHVSKAGPGGRRSADISKRRGKLQAVIERVSYKTLQKRHRAA